MAFVLRAAATGGRCRSIFAAAVLCLSSAQAFPQEEARRPMRCEIACDGLIGENAPARPLTEARIAAEPIRRREAYRRYLAASRSAALSDREALRSERRGLASIPAHRSPDAHGLDALDRANSAFSDRRSLEIARSVVSYQIPSGGWGKNARYTARQRLPGESWISDDIDPDAPDGRGWHFVGTLDNGASVSEIRFLANVQRAQTTDRALFRDSALRGIRWLLDAQYPDGGWPQIHPLAGGYADAITLNDDAMLGALTLLDAVASGGQDGEFGFVDASLRARCAAAAARGIEWLLDHQLTIDGRRTLWAQQYDPIDGAPTAARAFEMPAIASAESMRLLLFLMRRSDPSPRMRAAIRDGVAFVQATRMPGWRWEAGRLVPASDGALWARFYALDRYAPGAAELDARATALFGDRPEPHRSAAYGLVFATVASVSEERRRGYAQYNRMGDDVIEAWRAWLKVGPGSR